MDILLNTPAILKVLISLAIILIIDKKSHKLALSMAIGTIVLAFWAGHTIKSASLIIFETVTSVDYIVLIIMIFLIIWLSTQMKEIKIMNDLVNSLEQRLSGKTLLATVPTIIGLIPMPGGALFSAPLLDDCDREKILDPYLKTKINYWFRHVWEYWFPLYPGVMLCLQLTGLQVWQLAAINIPLTIFSLLGGYVLLLRKAPAKIQNCQFDKVDKKAPVFKYLFPIILIVLLYSAIITIFPYVSHISKYLPMGISILITIIYLQICRPLSGEKWKKIILSKSIAEMVLIVAVISIYGKFIEAPLPDGTHIMNTVQNELSSYNIPAIFLIIILPFISGIATGLAIGFVGVSFPIVISLLGSDPLLKDLLSAVVLAYAGGHIGQLLSPVHVCNIVTNKYFKTNLLISTAQLVPLCFFILAGAVFSVTLINLIL